MKMLRTKEVAKRLGISQRTVQRMVKRGSFQNAIRIDPKSKSIYLIPETDVELLISEQKVVSVQDLKTQESGH